MASSITTRNDGGLYYVTLSKAEKRNILSVEMVKELNAALDAAIGDASARIVILNAEGPAFCAGMDLKSVPLDDPPQAAAFAEALADAYRKLLMIPMPLFAAVDGPAMGGAVGLALAADMVFAGPNAKFAFPETKVGVVPALVSVIARRRVAAGILYGLALTGQTLSPERALALGFADSIAESSALDAATDFAKKVLHENSQGAMRRTKVFLQSQFERSLETELRDAISEFKEAVATDACARGLAAFREKKQIDWND